MSDALRDVDPELRNQLSLMADRWGALGVALTAAHLTDTSALIRSLQRDPNESPDPPLRWPGLEPFELAADDEDEDVSEIMDLIRFMLEGELSERTRRIGLRLVRRRVRNALLEAFSAGVRRRERRTYGDADHPDLEPLVGPEQSEGLADAMTVTFSGTEMSDPGAAAVRAVSPRAHGGA